MTVASRIKQGRACDYIDITDEEASHYTGAGWKLARFENGILQGFFDPGNLPYCPDRTHAANEAGQAALAWLAQAEGEIWIVMCSCYQMCNPRKIDRNNASDLAHMMRRWGEWAR